MVATSGSGWRLAPSLIALVDETDDRFPHREHGSDGSIGNLEHQTRSSDHNPDDGWVCAVDLDEDLSPTLHSIRHLWDRIVGRRDHRVKYLIYEGQIVKGYVDSAGHRPWVPYPYTGPNAHGSHLHVSIWNTAAARNDVRSWWENTEPVLPEEDDVATLIIRKENPKVRVLIPSWDRGPWYMSTDGGFASDHAVVVDVSAWAGIIDDPVNKPKIRKV